MTREERLDERQEQEALKSAKEIAKKKSKNKIQKIIWHAVKVAIIPFLLLFAKIMAVVILVCVVVSMFQGILDNGNSSSTSTDEEYNSSVSEQTGGMDITSENWQVSRDEIRNYINEYDTPNTALKNELLKENRIEQIYKWQEDTGYSAGLLITIALEENRNDFDDFLNEMNEKGKAWKEAGYTTIKQIAEDYVGDETAGEWANNIETKMQETGMDAGIIKNGEQPTSGDGYPNVYVSKSGKTYRNYKQNMGSYSNQQWCGTSIVKNDGCSLIAVTIIVSGYQNREIDPLMLAEQYAVIGSGMNIGGALSGNNIQYTEPLGRDIEFSTEQKKEIKNHVSRGNPAIIKVVLPSPFTTSQHYMAILDYNSSTNEFYLSNPWYGNDSYGKTGWVNADDVLYKCTRFYAIL